MTYYDDDDGDDELALPDRYTERAAETLAYRLMEYLESLGAITADHVSYLRYPPIELIEDAEKALRDEIKENPPPEGDGGQQRIAGGEII